MKGQVSWFERMAFLAAHPVGEYFWTSSAENPGNKYGGTWTQIKDVFLLAAGGSYAVGSTGGSATVGLTVNQLPKISGTISLRGNANPGSFRPTGGIFSNMSTDQTSLGLQTSGTTETENMVRLQFGNGEVHNNMLPYLTAYCWQRTA